MKTPPTSELAAALQYICVMDSSDLVELSAEELISKKDSIEDEIRKQRELLEAQRGVGMEGALTDAEGFPRADIDLYAVRTARNRIICLRNDHKTVMQVIEQKLHSIHAEARRRTGSDSNQTALSGRRSEAPRGFCRVNVVSEGSPAALVGLHVGDIIVEFGSVTTSNFTNLQEIAAVVQHSKEHPVRVVVLRRGEQMVLSLVPRQWAGRGLLGCNIIPL